MIPQQYLSHITEPVRLPQAALSLAEALAYPNLDSQRYLNRIEALASRAQDQIPGGLGVLEQAAALSRFLFGPGGFRGNSSDYYDPRNSFLNEVLDRKLGLPIMLTVLLIEVGERLGLDIRGVGLPGHFIAAAYSGGETVYMDPFHGGRTLTIVECQALVSKMGGPDITFNPDWLRPVSNYEILLRMLNNLSGVYLRKKDWEKALRVFELIQLTQPNDPVHAREIGLVHLKLGNLRSAIYHLESYILRNIHAPDLSSIRALLSDLVQREARAN